MNKFKAQYAALGMTLPKSKDPVKKADAIYLAACKKLGTEPKEFSFGNGLAIKYVLASVALLKLMIIRDAIADNKEADWNDGSYKYEPWFYFDAPGFRFAHADDYYTHSDVGSRLCLFSRLDAEFFGTECVALWSDLYGGTLPKK